MGSPSRQDPTTQATRAYLLSELLREGLASSAGLELANAWIVFVRESFDRFVVQGYVPYRIRRYGDTAFPVVEGATVGILTPDRYGNYTLGVRGVLVEVLDRPGDDGMSRTPFAALLRSFKVFHAAEHRYMANEEERCAPILFLQPREASTEFMRKEVGQDTVDMQLRELSDIQGLDEELVVKRMEIQRQHAEMINGDRGAGGSEARVVPESDRDPYGGQDVLRPRLGKGRHDPRVHLLPGGYQVVGTPYTPSAGHLQELLAHRSDLDDRIFAAFGVSRSAVLRTQSATHVAGVASIEQRAMDATVQDWLKLYERLLNKIWTFAGFPGRLTLRGEAPARTPAPAPAPERARAPEPAAKGDE